MKTTRYIREYLLNDKLPEEEELDVDEIRR